MIIRDSMFTPKLAKTTVHCNTHVHREKAKSNLRFGTKSHILCKSTQNTDFFLNPIFGFETEVNVDVKIKVIVLQSKEDMVMNIAQVNERLRQKFNHILPKKKLVMVIDKNQYLDLHHFPFILLSQIKSLHVLLCIIQNSFAFMMKELFRLVCITFFISIKKEKKLPFS